MKIFKLLILLLSTVFFLNLFSCGSSATADISEPDVNLLFATDNALPQPEINQVIGFVGDAIDNGTKKKRKDFIFCAALSHNPDTKTIVLDFGDTGCGNIIFRTGKISFTYLGEPQSQGNRTITFEDYTFNGNSLSGTIKLSNINTNASDNLEMSVELDNIVFTRQDGKSISLSSAHSYEWTAGSGTQSPLDDILEISGTSSGLNSQGNPFTAKIISPIIYETACLASNVPYPIKGTQEITPNTDPTFTLDYGSGTCDKNATISVGNLTTNVTFP